MKKYGFLLLAIACLASTLALVSQAETGSPAIQTAPSPAPATSPSPAPSLVPSPAPVVEDAKPESMIQKAEKVFEKTEEKIRNAPEKVKEKTEEVIEGKKPEPVKAEEETKLEEPAKAEEITAEKAEEKTEEKANEKAEEKANEKAEEKGEEKTDEKVEEKANEKADEEAGEEAGENTEMNSEENSEEKDAEDVPSDEGELTFMEETMDAPEIMPEDAFLRACFLHWFCHLNQHAHCWAPNCFFGHSDASSPIRRENPIEEMLPTYCIGLLTAPVPEALAVHFDLRPGTGLWVEHVIPGSPADEAGIHRGDILLQAKIHSFEDGEKTKKVFWLNHPILLMDLVEQIGPEEFELTTICNGKEQKTSLKPIERKELMEKAGILK